MASHLTRSFNGLNGMELKTCVLKQLLAGFQGADDPLLGTDWRKPVGAEVDRQLGMDDRFRIHITYPVIEWAWSFQAIGDPKHHQVRWVFALTVKAYPVDQAEWTVTIKGASRIASDQTFEAFEFAIDDGTDEQPPDKTRKDAGLPIPSWKSDGGGGRVELTTEDLDKSAQIARETVDSF